MSLRCLVALCPSAGADAEAEERFPLFDFVVKRTRGHSIVELMLPNRPSRCQTGRRVRHLLLKCVNWILLLSADWLRSLLGLLFSRPPSSGLPDVAARPTVVEPGKDTVDSTVAGLPVGKSPATEGLTPQFPKRPSIGLLVLTYSRCNPLCQH